MYVYICTYVCMGVAKNPVWLGIDMLIYHWTSLAKTTIQSSSSVAIQSRGDAHLNILWGGEMAGNQ